MMDCPRIILKKGKEEPVRRFHPWIFSGALDHAEGEIEEGDIVEVFSSSGEYLATGHAQHGSIAVKIFSFHQADVNLDFWMQKLNVALRYRHALGFNSDATDDAYRLVNGEGDGLPGLIIDYLSGTAVIQCHSLGMHLAVENITAALKTLLGRRLKAVYEKSADVLSETTSFEMTDGFRYGDQGINLLTVDHLIYHFNIQGQKTGFFLDQRVNRKRVEEYARGRRVLDVYSYSGGFSLHALRGDALQVHAVDSSKKATELALANVIVNELPVERFKTFTADARQYLASNQQEYDMIILDPPAFAKHHDMKAKAIQGYSKINYLAIKQIRQGGFLFTFSCSQAVDRSAFQSAVMAAAIDSGRKVTIVEYLSQSPDHTVSVFHPEGMYLKGLVLYIE